MMITMETTMLTTYSARMEIWARFLDQSPTMTLMDAEMLVKTLTMTMIAIQTPLIIARKVKSVGHQRLQTITILTDVGI